MMQPSEQLFALTRQAEGLRLQLYRDVVGCPTIGYGHLVKPGEDFIDGISEHEAELLLQADMAQAAGDVAADVTVLMNQGEFDALCDFVYNLGDRLKSSSLLRLLNSGNTDAAEQQLLEWDFAGGKPNAGLKARRVLEMNLWSLGNAG